MRKEKRVVRPAYGRSYNRLGGFVVRADYSTEEVQLVRVKGIDCQFTDIRIDRTTVPEGKFMYEVGGDDDCGDEPTRVKKGILVNFFGTLISEVELPLDEEGVLWLEEGDFEWVDTDWRFTWTL